MSNKGSLPEVFQMDEQERSHLLSRMGILKEEESSLFHKICSFQKDELDYDYFVAQVSPEGTFGAVPLLRLMSKVKSARRGLIKHTFQSGELIPDKIILCDEGSHAFYYHILGNEFVERMAQGSVPSFCREKLAEQGIMVPSAYIISLELPALGPSYIEQAQGQQAIYRIAFRVGGECMMTTEFLESQVENSYKLVFTTLSDNEAIAAGVARILSMKTGELQAHKDRGDWRFWKEFGATILGNLEGLQTRYPNISLDFLHASEFLFHYNHGVGREEEETRQGEVAKNHKVDEFCGKIKSEGVYPFSQFVQEMGVYESQWSDFKESFRKKKMTSHEKMGCPEIVAFKEVVLHRDNVYAYFRDELTNTGRQLEVHYVEIMGHLLRTKNRDKVPIFYTRGSFINDIKGKLAKDYPTLAELLKKPKVVSEASVHYFRMIKGIEDTKKIRELLLHFFNSEKMVFKDVDILLGLKMTSIFEVAFRELSFFDRFLLTLMGRKGSLEKQFIENDAKLLSPSSSGPKRSASAGRSARQSDSSKGTISLGGQGPGGGKAVSGTESRAYTKRQRDEAWGDFQSVLKKKHDKS